MQDSLGFSDSTPWISDSRQLIRVFFGGFWIPILSRIPDSLSFILDSKALDSGFQKEKFHGLRNPDSSTLGDLIINGDNTLVLCYMK